MDTLGNDNRARRPGQPKPWHRERTAATALVVPALLVAIAACGSESPAVDDAAVEGVAALTGEPIEVGQTETWEWVPIEGSMCADGTSAGVGVNFTAQSRDLVIWFQGNGVCFDQTSCTLYSSILVGMGPDPLDHMWWGDPNTAHTGIFDRDDPENPFRDSNFVVFPHCGVDGHTADKKTTYPSLGTIHQHGYANVTVALERIVPSFPDAGRIVVAGFSAGGIGAGSNYHQIAEAFATVGQPPPFLINDSGPVLRPPYAGPRAHSSLRDGWGLDTTIDSWCPRCGTEGYHVVLEAVAELHPGMRASIISSYADNVATPLYGLLNADFSFNGTRFEEGLHDLAGWTESYQDSVSPSVGRVFYYPGDRHGALAVDSLSATPGLTAFLNAQLDGDLQWATVEP